MRELETMKRYTFAWIRKWFSRETERYQGQKHTGGLFCLNSFLQNAFNLPARRLAVAAPYDRATLESCYLAHKRGVIKPLMVGNESKIIENARQFDVPVQGFTMYHCEIENTCEMAASLLMEKKADFIMKGMVGTGNFIHVLLDPKWKIRTESILSHVGLFEIPETKRLFLVSDAAINIQPNFTRKIQIVENAVGAAKKLGMKHIKIAMLSAVEKVNLPAIPSTLDAFLMKQFAQTGYFQGCEIDGPFAFDNALDPICAKTKGVPGNVAGNADIVIVPNIETGNVIWKSITSLQKGEAAGVVLGGSCPIVVPSRADTTSTKLLSIQLARLLLE
jgi:phosphate butyryltransferase